MNLWTNANRNYNQFHSANDKGADTQERRNALNEDPHNRAVSVLDHDISEAKVSSSGRVKKRKRGNNPVRLRIREKFVMPNTSNLRDILIGPSNNNLPDMNTRRN